MTKSEQRIKKRKEVVEAIVVRQEPVHLVARIYKIPQRTVFDWLATLWVHHKNGGGLSITYEYTREEGIE